MLIIPFSNGKRSRRKLREVAAAVEPLVLVSAEFLDWEPSVLLTFDRAIDRSGIDPGAFTVDDPVTTNSRFGVSSWEAQDDNQVKFALQPVGAAEGEDVTLTASAANGIKALDDGSPWAGGSVVLPYNA